MPPELLSIAVPWVVALAMALHLAFDRRVFATVGFLIAQASFALLDHNAVVFAPCLAWMLVAWDRKQRSEPGYQLKRTWLRRVGLGVLFVFAFLDAGKFGHAILELRAVNLPAVLLLVGLTMDHARTRHWFRQRLLRMETMLWLQSPVLSRYALVLCVTLFAFRPWNDGASFSKGLLLPSCCLLGLFSIGRSAFRARTTETAMFWVIWAGLLWKALLSK